MDSSTLQIVLAIITTLGLDRLLQMWLRNRQQNKNDAYSLTLQNNAMVSKDYWKKQAEEAEKLARLESEVSKQSNLADKVVELYSSIEKLRGDFKVVTHQRDELKLANSMLTEKYTNELTELRRENTKQSQSYDKEIKRLNARIAKQDTEIKQLKSILSTWYKLINLLPQDDKEVKKLIAELNSIFGD